MVTLRPIIELPRPAPTQIAPREFEVRLDEWLDRADSARRWLIPGWLPFGGLVLVTGTRKLTYKTYTCLTLASALASGHQIMPFDPESSSTVLFFLEEGAVADVKDKWRAIAAANPGVERGWQNIHFVFRKIIKLNVPDSREQILDAVHKHHPDLVIFDPLVYMIEGDENKTSDMNDALRTFQEIMATGATVVVAHHLNNEKGYKKRGVDIDQQVRGAGPLKDLYDAHIALRRYDEKDKHVQVTVRLRSGPTRKETFWWEFHPDDPTGTEPTEFAKLHVGRDEGDGHASAEGSDEGGKGEDRQGVASGGNGDDNPAGQRFSHSDDRNYLALLEPGTEYSQKDLSILWATATADTKLITESFVDHGFLVSDKNGIMRLPQENDTDDREEADFELTETQDEPISEGEI